MKEECELIKGIYARGNWTYESLNTVCGIGMKDNSEQIAVRSDPLPYSSQRHS